MCFPTLNMGVGGSNFSLHGNETSGVIKMSLVSRKCFYVWFRWAFNVKKCGEYWICKTEGILVLTIMALRGKRKEEGKKLTEHKWRPRVKNTRLPERRSRDSASISQSGDAGDCQQWWSAKFRCGCHSYVDTCGSLDVSRNLYTGSHHKKCVNRPKHHIVAAMSKEKIQSWGWGVGINPCRKTAKSLRRAGILYIIRERQTVIRKKWAEHNCIFDRKTSTICFGLRMESWESLSEPGHIPSSPLLLYKRMSIIISSTVGSCVASIRTLEKGIENTDE